MKRIGFVLMLAVLSATLAFAGGGRARDDGPRQRPADGWLFGFTCMQLSNPFFTILEATIREEVERRGDRLITVDPAMDPVLQINQIEDLIVQRIDAIFLNPVDWQAIRPALQALNRANIPIINFDAEVYDMNLVTAYAGSDNFNAGYVCGVDLVRRFPNGGPIAILESPTMNSVRDRIDGFEHAIMGRGFDIVFRRDALGDLPTAMRHTEDMLIAHPNVIAIMGGNDPTALGALAALRAAGRTDIIIYGVDGSPEAKAAIAEGSPFVGSGAQSPISIARYSVRLAYQILNNEPFEARVPVPTFLINEYNVLEFGIDGWQ